MGCPEWLRKDMKKTGQSKPTTGVRDMGSLFHKKEVKGYADGGSVSDETYKSPEYQSDKQRGLDASSGERVGLWERLKAGNIDDPSSEAYRRFGAGRGKIEKDFDEAEKQMDQLDAMKKEQATKAAAAPKAETKAESGSSDTMPFGKAFAAARKSGAKTFDWKGKSYTTELAGEKKDAPKPAAKPAEKPAAKSATPKAAPAKSQYNSTPSREDMKVMFNDAMRGGSTGLNFLRRMVEVNELSLADAQRARRILKERNAE